MILTRPAHEFGQARGTLLQQGISVGRMDLMIGSVALVHNLTLVTHNTADFENIPGLRLDDWLDSLRVGQLMAKMAEIDRLNRRGKRCGSSPTRLLQCGLRCRQGDGKHRQPVDHNRIMVRARIQSHLEALKKRYPGQFSVIARFKSPRGRIMPSAYSCRKLRGQRSLRDWPRKPTR